MWWNRCSAGIELGGVSLMSDVFVALEAMERRDSVAEVTQRDVEGM